MLTLPKLLLPSIASLYVQRTILEGQLQIGPGNQRIQDEPEHQKGFVAEPFKLNMRTGLEEKWQEASSRTPPSDLCSDDEDDLME